MSTDDKPQQMSGGWWDPILWDARMGAPTAPRNVPQALDNAQKSEVLLYGPKGEPLIRREPRPVGFRKP